MCDSRLGEQHQEVQVCMWDWQHWELVCLYDASSDAHPYLVLSAMYFNKRILKISKMAQLYRYQTKLKMLVPNEY